MLLKISPLIAQTDSIRTADHSIYLEIGGAGGYGAINYEQVFFKKKELSLAGRVGISTYHIKDFNHKFNPDIILPLTFKILYGKNHKAELGAGEIFTATIHAAETNLKPKRKANLHTHFSIGYRYQRSKGGIMAGVSYTPVIEFNHAVKHWAAVSIGYSF